MQIPKCKCKISGSEWLDLTFIRRIQFELDPPVLILTWTNGDSQVYNGDQALAVVKVCEEVGNGSVETA